MPDSEMAPGEIARRLTSIDAHVANLVGRAEYEEAQRHVDTRVRAIEQDVKDIRDDVGGLKTQRENDSKRTDDRRWLILGLFFAPPITILLNRLMESAIGAGP